MKAILILLLTAATTGHALAQTQPARRPHGKHTPPPFPQTNPQRPQFGDPLPGLTTQQLAAFFDGRDDFEQPETAESGLGPIFNRDSCVACHSHPATGGSSNIFVTRFGSLLNGIFDPLESLGGSLLQDNSILGHQLEQIPPQANVIAHRQSPPLFGLGLIEAIPDATILKNVRIVPVDGVKGRPAMIVDIATGQTRVGHFGWKAQHANLLSFAADAYLNEMGITNRFFPTENAPNGNLQLLAQLDKVADPEDKPDPVTGLADIDRVTNFLRLIGPPPRGPVTPLVQTGSNLFQQTGCAVCHTPQMLTGSNAVGALSLKQVNLFSDLLLHDMGSLNDGIAQASAGVNEMKTPPLWGLLASAPYLHDGRAATVDAAILAHDGEGKVSRDRYLRLSPAQRQSLLDFLNSL